MTKVKYCPAQSPILDWWENDKGTEVIDGVTNFKARYQGRDIVVLQQPGRAPRFMDLETMVTEQPVGWDGYLEVSLSDPALDSIVMAACNLDEVDDALYIRQVRDATCKVLDSDSQETLQAIYSRGPLSDGDVPSKVQRNELLSIGVINKCVVNGEDGYQSCNYLGRDVLRVLSLKG